MTQIIATVDRFEGEYAVLKHKDHEILLSRDEIPADAKEGSVLALTVMTQKQAEQDRTERAQELLNDILTDALRQGVDTRPESEKIAHEELASIKNEEKATQETTKKIEDENKKLDSLNKKMDDLDKRLKG